MPTDRVRVTGVILAAGPARRMGRNKLLLELDGEPLVRRAARRALAAGLSSVVVVLGHEADLARQALTGVDCVCVVNPAFAGPASESLHVALRALPPDAEAILVLLADMVHVSESMIAAVLEAAAQPAPLVVSRYGDVTAPPVLFRRTVFAELLAWTGDGCGKAVVRRHHAEAVFVEWPEHALADIDTEEDFRALRLGVRGEA